MYQVAKRDHFSLKTVFLAIPNSSNIQSAYSFFNRILFPQRHINDKSFYTTFIVSAINVSAYVV